jgi:uncharacterized damage-inducible protein DinB
LLLLTASVLSVNAQSSQAAADQFRREFLTAFADGESKAIRLAEAIPPEKYAWRPAPGVRSISEVFVHIANGDQLLLSLVNGSSRSTKDAAFQALIASNEAREKKVTTKEAVVTLVKQSFQQVRSVLENATDADLSREVEFFGGRTSGRGVFLVISNHVNEHLGQSIRYARMNGIVPPWSK